MAERYLLPCSCGRKIPVELRQAGQAVRCSCGASLQVPTMRETADLERAEPAAAPPRASAPWGVRQSVALIGALVLLSAVGMAVFLLCTRPRRPAASRPKPEAEVIRRQIGRLTPLESWRFWHSLLAAGPDGRTRFEERRHAARLAGYRDRLVRWWLWAGVVLVIAVAGAALVTVPLVMGRRSVAKPAG